MKDGEKWNVYYSERGCKTTNKYFDSESDALEYMCKELSESKIYLVNRKLICN